MFELETIMVGISFEFSELKVREGVEDIFLSFEDEENEDQNYFRTERDLIP